MKNFILKRSVLWALLLLTAALAVGTYFLRHTLTPAEAPKPAFESVPVEGQLVQVAPFISQLMAIGTLVANDSITVKPEIEGVIAKIAFESGQVVKKNQPLYILDDSLAKAKFNEAQAQLKLATLDYTRAKQLADQKFVSAKELDKLFATFEVAKAQEQAARATLEKAQIEAPFEGIVGINSLGVGAYIRPGEDLVSLVNVDPMKVDFRIGEEYLQRLTEGLNVTVKVDGFEEEFEGVITAIEPNVDPVGHSVLVRASIKNPDKKLRPGLFANIILTLKIEEEAILIPESALESEGGAHFVYRIVEGIATKTPVTVGGYKEGMAYISEGLWRTDVVITVGGMKIGDGVAVELVEPNAKLGSSEQKKTKSTTPPQKSLVKNQTEEKASSEGVPSSQPIDHHAEYQSLLEESSEPPISPSSEVSPAELKEGK